jgi:exopolysaccharide biosynthesis protein
LEAISGFGNIIISNGQITPSAASGRASRTAVGITKTGKVVFVVLDGRQEPFSCGGSFSELAQILKEAGCVEAMNLDGGGSSTYVAKQPGDDALSLINSPSDGYARSVGASWMIVSTAPSSTTFDHALLETETDYLTVGSSVQVTPTAVSAAGNAVGLPEGTTWAVSDEAFGTISEDGVFTAHRNGDVNVNLMLDDTVIGTKTLDIVTPDNVYFTKTNIDTVYGATTELPVKVLYQRKEVAFNANDLTFTVSNAKAGSFSGLNFV